MCDAHVLFLSSLVSLARGPMVGTFIHMQSKAHCAWPQHRAHFLRLYFGWVIIRQSKNAWNVTSVWMSCRIAALLKACFIVLVKEFTSYSSWTKFTNETNFPTGISCLRSPHLDTYRPFFVSSDNASGRFGKLLIVSDIICHIGMRLEKKNISA